MSYEFGLTTRVLDLPTAQTWSEAAKSLGYELEIEQIDWASHMGYLPMKLCGRELGFEVYREAVTRKGLFGHKPTGEMRIAFRLGFFEHEAAAASVALQSLLSCIDGSVWTDDDDDFGHAELVVSACDQYLSWRILFAREHAGGEGLPADQPPLAERLETVQTRIQLVQTLCDQHKLEPSGHDGWYRLHQSVQRELEHDRSLRGLA